MLCGLFPLESGTKSIPLALASVAQLAGALCHNQMVEGSISCQCPYLGCEFDTQSRKYGKEPIDVSLSPFLSPFPHSLKSNEKIKINLKKRKKNIPLTSLLDLFHFGRVLYSLASGRTPVIFYLLLLVSSPIQTLANALSNTCITLHSM